MGLSEEEHAIVEVVRYFVDKAVRPQAQELQHTNTQAKALIKQRKSLGVFGLAIPEPYGSGRVSTP